MEVVDALLLGLVQGLTEWLPVSSSGHLAILQEIRGLQVPVFFDVLLHVMTAMVVITYLRTEVIEILRSLSRSLRRWRAGERLSVVVRDEEGARTAWLIAVGSIPTAIIAFATRSYVEPLFTSLEAIGIALLITGAILSTTYFVGRGAGRALRTKDSLLMGAVQGAALIPGISRSGSTISVGLILGGERVKVAKFSFLLSVPAILGAAAVGVLELGGTAWSVEPVSLVAALTATAIFGFASLKFLMTVISRTRLHVFAPYCFVLGSLLLALQFL